VLRAYSGPEVEVDYSAAASLASMAEHEDAQEEMAEAQAEAAATSAAKAAAK
jgi:glycogen operon protein